MAADLTAEPTTSSMDETNDDKNENKNANGNSVIDNTQLCEEKQPTNDENVITNQTNTVNAGRKGKKRKKFYLHNNKNKKRLKQFKRQKLQNKHGQVQANTQNNSQPHVTNKIQSDSENTTFNQSNKNVRNKHNNSNMVHNPGGNGSTVSTNTKPSKVNFNNKNVLIHRQNFNKIPKFFLPRVELNRPRKDVIVPPTKFLLGGNISDPLNLSSLQDEALNASMNAATPKSSPITTPPKVEVIIPPNIRDPLHLFDPVDSIEYEKQLTSPMKQRKGKNRSRKKRARKMEVNQLIKSLGPTSTIVSGAYLAEKENIEKPSKLLETKIMSPKTACSTSVQKINEPKVAAVNPVDKNSERDKIKEMRLELCGNDQTGNRKRRISENQGGAKPKVRRLDSLDKIVSPVIPQPGAWKRPPRIIPDGAPRGNRTRTLSMTQNQSVENESIVNESVENMADVSSTTNLDKSMDVTKSEEKSNTMEQKPVDNSQADGNSNKDATKKKFKFADAKYQYGNYDRYYGYRNLNESMDVRLKVFHHNQHLFKDKDVLDIGCNVGHITIAVAKQLHTKSVTGIDIDQLLITRAKRNLSFYVPLKVDKQSSVNEPTSSNAGNKRNRGHKGSARMKSDANLSKFYPISFPISFGGIPRVEKSLNDSKRKEVLSFPQNVFFRVENYVPKDENSINCDTQQQYDLILCLSLTKWIHLNFGDAALKLTFRRMFNELRPGGKLILEAQNWASYKKRKKLTDKIYENYNSIEFYPNKFHEYLLSPEVGFSHSFTLGVPRHASKGFGRPIQLYVKGDFTPSQVRWSDNYHPQTPYESHRGIYLSGRRPTYPNSSVWRGQETPYYGNNSYRMASTSQYYNPLETDSYTPSYDTEQPNRRYCFASPLYSQVWSPPSGGQGSGPNSPLLSGSVREADSNDYSVEHHVYPPNEHQSVETGSGRESYRSNDDLSSPRNHLYARTPNYGSVREPNEQSYNYDHHHRRHIYAVNTNDNSQSPNTHDDLNESPSTTYQRYPSPAVNEDLYMNGGGDHHSE